MQFIPEDKKRALQPPQVWQCCCWRKDPALLQERDSTEVSDGSKDRTMILYIARKTLLGAFFQPAVTVSFPGVLGVTEKRRWKKVDFWSLHAVSIEAGRSMKVQTAVSIPASSDGSRGAGDPPPARLSHIRPNNKRRCSCDYKPADA
jgi:hypothetical protein